MRWTYDKDGYLLLRAGRAAIYRSREALSPIFVIGLKSVALSFITQANSLRDRGAPVPRRRGNGDPISGDAEMFVMHLISDDDGYGSNVFTAKATMVLYGDDRLRRSIDDQVHFDDRLSEHLKALGMQKQRYEEEDA